MEGSRLGRCYEHPTTKVHYGLTGVVIGHWASSLVRDAHGVDPTFVGHKRHAADQQQLTL